ncbi:hypothetical protein ACV07N_10170 [Roseivirga echinicomitans]
MEKLKIQVSQYNGLMYKNMAIVCRMPDPDDPTDPTDPDDPDEDPPVKPPQRS